MPNMDLNETGFFYGRLNIDEVIKRYFKLVGTTLMDTYYFFLLDSVLKKENPNDNRVIECGIRRKQILKELESDGRMKLIIRFSTEGNRLIHTYSCNTNYRINPATNVIEYDNNTIKEVPGQGFEVHSNSKVVQDFYNEKQALFIELSRVETELQRLSLEKGVEFARLINNDTNMSLAFLNSCNMPFGSYNLTEYQQFCLNYGKEGVINLVKWLNKLAEEDIDDLARELYAELEAIKIKNDLSDEDINKYEKSLFKSLALYSPRAYQLEKRLDFLRNGDEENTVVYTPVLKIASQA